MYLLLKNTKTCSNDGIINEYIKATAYAMMPLCVAFFNLVFNLGVIRPIYKTKGNSKNLPSDRFVSDSIYINSLTMDITIHHTITEYSIQRRTTSRRM